MQAQGHSALAVLVLCELGQRGAATIPEFDAKFADVGSPYRSGSGAAAKLPVYRRVSQETVIQFPRISTLRKSHQLPSLIRPDLSWGARPSSAKRFFAQL